MLGRYNARLKVTAAVLALVAAFGIALTWHARADLRDTYAVAGEQAALATAKMVRHELRPTRLRADRSLNQRLSGLAGADGNVTSIRLIAESRGELGVAAAWPAAARWRSVDPLAARVTRTGAPAFRDVQEGGRHQTAVLYPVRTQDAGVSSVIEVRVAVGALDSALRHSQRESMRFTIGASIVMLLLLSILLGRTIFVPLAKIRSAARRVAEGQLDARVDYDRRDELGQLARDFDAMAARVQESHARLEALARKDPLTELSNHRDFHERLAEGLKQARLDCGPLSVVVIDTDLFKAINDTHGHPAGDQVLRQVAQRLGGVIRSGDSAARVGGEEFALILPGADTAVAHAAAERARAALAEITVAGTPISCSAGVASYPADAWTLAALVELADAGLYAAKRAGRDRTGRYDEPSDGRAPGSARAEIAQLLDDPEGVTPVFQPVVAMASGEVAGYEALARFPGRTQRPPDAWFAHAHRYGLGPALEATALRAALSRDGRPEGAELFLNVSPSALTTQDVWSVLPADLTGITIEVTEHELASETHDFSEALARVRDRGGRIAVDDAGAGYAGLQHLMQIRPDIIKLDRSLIDGVAHDSVKAALIESFGSFARRTGAALCAEGIETLEDLQALGQLGVAYAQGYALARPSHDWGDVDPDAAATCRATSNELALSPNVVSL